MSYFAYHPQATADGSADIINDMSMASALLSVLLIGLAIPGVPYSGKKKAPLGNEFRIGVGDKAVIGKEKLTVSFVSVLEDSRCPRGVNCVWQGNAKISIEIKVKGEKPATVDLNTTLVPREADSQGYRISLVDLTPQPGEGEANNPADYRATLKVTKL
jgi:hypothetical protein